MTVRTYVTKVWCPPRDDGRQRLHQPMREPAPLPDARHYVGRAPGPDARLEAHRSRPEPEIEGEVEAEP